MARSTPGPVLKQTDQATFCSMSAAWYTEGKPDVQGCRYYGQHHASLSSLLLWHWIRHRQNTSHHDPCCRPHSRLPSTPLDRMPSLLHPTAMFIHTYIYQTGYATIIFQTHDLGLYVDNSLYQSSVNYTARKEIHMLL